MSKQLIPTQIISTKKNSLRKLNNLLESYINSPDNHNQKKALLISNWISKFVAYTSFEDQFDPTQNISYKRGNIIKVNFGFNVGCELGGVHYAVVLDKQNKHSADTVTVIPLISVKEGKSTYERDVYLGNELYSTLNGNFNRAFQQAKERYDELAKMQQLSSSLLETLFTTPDSPEKDEQIEKTKAFLDKFSKELESANKKYQYLEDLGNEIILMKQGSIARIEQITSISKMRIYIPRKKSDVLYNISFSENSMKKINEKVKELFVFNE